MTASSEQQQQQEDFVDVSPPQRNWKGIAISLLVIVVVCSLISMSVVVLTPAELPGSRKSRMTVWDLHKPDFSLQRPEATWIGDSEVLYRNADGHIVTFSLILNETRVLLWNSTFAAFNAVKFSLSADGKFALLAYNVTPVYRHSYTASYIIYNVHTREVLELNPPEVQNAVLQHASWGKQGQQLVYVFENNIYYQAGTRSPSLRLTSSGLEGVVFNGVADWLYEEEVLGSQLALWWSPDGQRLAFLTIDDSLVPNALLPQLTGGSYPRGRLYPYPMAGQVNPAVRLSVVSLSGATLTQELQPPDSLAVRDLYVSMVSWISSTRLAVRWLNRPQNRSVLAVCDAAAGRCLQRRRESSETWLSRPSERPLFSEDSAHFLLTLPVKQGDQGEFHHLTLITRKVHGQDEVRHLTSGAWEVTHILSYDQIKHIVYLLSTEDGAQNRHLYSVSTLGAFPRRCLTCSLREGCSFYEADVSPDARHAILKCQGPGVPAVLLLSLDDVDTYFILEENLALRAALDAKRTVQTEIRTIVHQDFELPLKLTYPADFSQSSIYGLLLIVGSSPGRQQVTEQFSLHWDRVLVGSEQVVVARLDGRGSGFRGQRLSQQIHQRLGVVDTEDQIAALQYLVKLPFIDRTRVGVYGEAYGGYLTLTMLKSSEKLIRCAAARAPVTDWSLYASSFSERYLGPPSTEDSRYQASRVLPSMRGVQGGAVFLAHGTADAHVHFQHSAELIKHFIQIGANYTLQMYPDEGHFLSEQSQIQLTHSLLGYFRGCLLEAASPLLHQRDAD
ncbi:inactive dipeptidyl peptidase 10-like [Salarias fasciatus]|uniref:inactive dipeptidyl peptidase 10-like n=1 Tax=Salarias fasciatus TaxID=181472 RepID=UPI001176FC78|nr:inactive dipeptidyl peptidase 10-like [Salarias fasciatus]